MRKSKSKQKKENKKYIRFKFGDSEAEEINDSEIEEGEILNDDSDQDNKIQPKEAGPDNTKAVNKLPVKDTRPAEDTDNVPSTTNAAENTDSVTKNTVQAVSKTVVINTPVSTQANKQTETTMEVETQSAVDDSDQDNKTQPKEDAPDNTKAVNKVAVEDTWPTEDTDNVPSTTNVVENTDSTTKNIAQAVSKIAVINKPVSTQASKQTENATEVETQNAADAKRTKLSNKLQQ